eukprot:1546265-Prymnesium_polylepis.1
MTSGGGDAEGRPCVTRELERARTQKHVPAPACMNAYMKWRRTTTTRRSGGGGGRRRWHARNRGRRRAMCAR